MTCEATSIQVWALRLSVCLLLLISGLGFPTAGRDTCLAPLSGLMEDRDCPDRESGLKTVMLTLLLASDNRAHPSPPPTLCF